MFLFIETPLTVGCKGASDLKHVGRNQKIKEDLRLPLYALN